MSNEETIGKQLVFSYVYTFPCQTHKLVIRKRFRLCQLRTRHFTLHHFWFGSTLHDQNGCSWTESGYSRAPQLRGEACMWMGGGTHPSLAQIL